MARLAIGLAGAAIGGAIGGPVGARIGFGLASTAASYFLQPDIHQEGPRIDDAQVTSSAYGQTLPIVWGVMPVAGHIIDASPVRRVGTTTEAGGGKGGPSQTVTTYSYFSDIAVAIHGGEISELLLIRANGKIIYDARPDAEVVQPDWLKFTLYKGTETQAPDPTLQALNGAANQPAYLGTAYVVFEDFAHTELGNTFAVNFEFVVARSGANPFTRTATQVSTTGSTSSDVRVLHEPATDLLIHALNGDSDNALVAVNPYTREIVWTVPHEDESNVRDIDLACKPISIELGQTVYTRGLIVVLKSYTTAGTQSVVLYDAASGVKIDTIYTGGHNSASPPTAVAYGYHDQYFSDAYFIVDIDLLGPQFYRTNQNSVSGGTVDIDWPSGWYGTTMLCSNGAGKILVALQDSFVSATSWGVSVFTVELEQWTTVSTTTAAIQAMEWCGDQWAIAYGTTGNTVIKLVSTSGLVTDTIDINTDFSITDNYYYTSRGYGLAYSDTENALYLQGTNAIYRIDLNDPTATPQTWSAGYSTPVHLYHRESDRIWWPTDGGDDAYSMRLHAATGSAATLDDVVSDLSIDGTELTSSDISVTALSAIDVRGFVVSRPMERRVALQQLMQAFLFDYVPRNGVITAILRGQSSSATLTEDNIGAYIEGGSPSEPWTIKRAAGDQLPIQVEVTFIDPDHNFEPGTQLAQRQASSTGTVQRYTLAVSMTNDEAAQLADAFLHLAHIEAETYESQTMPSTIDSVQPAAVLTTSYDGDTYTYRVVEGSIVDGRMVAMRALREVADVFTGYAVGGTPRAPNGVVQLLGRSTVWPMDLPMLRNDDTSSGIYLATFSYTPNWPGALIQRSADGNSYADALTVFDAAVMGVVRNAPTTGVAMYWDLSTTIEVTMVNGDLASTDRDNPTFAAWGINGRWEIVAFTTASQGDDGTWSVSDLARGQLDTFDHVTDHAPGDYFVVLDTATIRTMAIPSASVGATEYVRAVTLGRSIDTASSVPYAYAGERFAPYAPVSLDAQRDGSNNWSFSWQRSDRIGGRLLWDRANSESAEQYTVQVLDTLGNLVHTATVDDATTYQFTAADQISAVGYEMPLLTFRVAQVSAIVGNGHWASMGAGTDPQYAQTVIDDSPMLFHLLGETSGTTAEDAVGSLDGTYTNSPTLGDPPVLTFGYGVTFGSGSDYCITAVPWNDGTRPRAVEFAFRIDALPSSGSAVIWRTAQTDTSYGLTHCVSIESSGKLRFRNWRAGDLLLLNDVQSTATLAVDTNYHVIINWGTTASVDDIEFYINGVTDTAQTINIGVADAFIYAVRLVYGKDTTSQGFGDFQGTLQAVSFYSSELDSTTRDDHFTAGGRS